jgi:peptide/nickel transport system permease protein
MGILYPRWMRSARVLSGLAGVAAVLAVAAFAPLLAPNDPQAQDLTLTMQGVRLGSSHPLGTDALGRCVLSRLLHGAALALRVAVVAALGAMVLGAALGVAAGFLGGWVDRTVGWAVDAWTAFPPLVLAVVLMVGLGAASGHVALAIVLVDWTRFCRAMRAEAAAVAGRDHVAAARLLGLGPGRLLVGEVLPAVLPLLAALLAWQVGIGVAVEAMLSFLGLGAGPDEVAWGRMIADGREAIHAAPANLLAPAAALCATVAGFTLLGDGLRRTLRLRLREAGR